MKTKRLLTMVFACVVLLSCAAVAQAVELNAADGGWSITVDNERVIRDGEGTATDGLVNWIDPSGYDYVYQDTWFGRDSTAQSEGPLSSMSLLSSSQPALNKIILNFKDNASLYLDLSYELTGSGLSSSILERGVMTNKGADPLTISIFKYVDFDLCYGYDAHNNDYAFGDTSGITQYDAFSTARVTPISSLPDAFQISRCGYPGSIISSLDDGQITNLTNGGSPFGPEDADFAFQWNLTLDPNQSYTIENMKTLETSAVPEPVSSALFLLGCGGMAALKRSKKA